MRKKPAPSSYNRLPAQTNWLESELATCKELMPQLDLQVMFGDDLPDTEPMLRLMEKNLANGFRMTKPDYGSFMRILNRRYIALEKAITGHFKDPAIGEAFARQAQEQDFRLAYPLCVSDVQTERYQIENVCGEKIQSQAIVPPTKAFILLAPRFFDSVSALSFTTNIPVNECVHDTQHGLHLPEFLHERAHLEMMTRGDTVIPWLEERNADMTATATLSDRGQLDQAGRFVLFRALGNFLGQVSDSASAYWNVLSQREQTPFSTDGILRDKSATLELKIRAARQLNNTDPMKKMRGSELQQLERLLHSPYHAGLRDLYSSMSVTSALERKVLMHALDRVVEQDAFTYPETRYLAQLTQEAAHTYFPAVLADKKQYTPYLKDAAPAP